MSFSLYIPELLLALIAWAIIGLAIMAAGIWPRRRGETPYCRKCGYNLTGIASEHCPECGKTTGRRGTVFGLRKRKPLRILLGFLPICPLLGVAIYAAENYDWYQHKPFFWVLSDFRSSNPSLSGKACKEIGKRCYAKELTPAQVSAFIDAHLAWKGQSGVPHLSPYNYFLEDSFAEGWMSNSQVDEYFRQIRNSTIKLNSIWELIQKPALIRNPPRAETQPKLIDLLLDFQSIDVGKPVCNRITAQEYADYLAKCYQKEYMNESQKERFLRQISLWDLEIRPWIILGERLPFKLKQTLRCPSKPWAISIRDIVFAIDNTPMHLEPFYSQPQNAHDFCSFPFIIEQNLTQGKHVMEFEIPYEIGFESTNGDIEFTPFYHDSIHLRKEFEVLETLPNNYRCLIADETLRKDIVNCIETSTFHFEEVRTINDKAFLWGRIFVDSPPADLAFEVFYKLGDVETRAGALVSKTNSSRKYLDYTITVSETDARALDVIFRSSEILVRESTDIFQAWDGEIVFANIPIAQSEDG